MVPTGTCWPRPAAVPTGWLWTQRLVQLYLGLVLYGVSAAMMVRARLGVDPWDVLHQGLAGRTHHAMGTVSITVGALVLLLWWPLRQRPGLGTVSNVVVLGLAMNEALRVLPAQHALVGQSAVLIGGILLCGLATGMYISAGLGPGPRDGLMTGVARRTGCRSGWPARSSSSRVLAVGWLLGGSVGIGTLLFAVSHRAAVAVLPAAAADRLVGDRRAGSGGRPPDQLAPEADRLSAVRPSTGRWYANVPVAAIVTATRCYKFAYT